MAKFEKNSPKPPGSGRKKGTPNKTTSQMRELAQMHGEKAIATLVQLMGSADSDSARIAAAKEILDRGYGKSKSSHEISGLDGAPIIVTEIRRVIVDPNGKSSGKAS